MRLIDADELLTAFPVDDEPMLTKSCVRMTIQRMPTVDAAPVVRCRDCESYQINFHWCGLHYMEMHPKDFCSYGERKDGDGNG